MGQGELDLSECRTQRVVKANELIQKSRFNLTVQQQKIVLYLISQITPYDDDLKEYEFFIPEFCRVCGIDYTQGDYYPRLKEAIINIKNSSFFMDCEGMGEDVTLDWISKAHTNKGSGVIRIRLDEDMKPYLLQLKENFTQYELLWVLRFKCKYAIRLYELMKSIHFHELENYERTYTLDELKQLIGAETYDTYQTFKTRALLPAIGEINRYSDKNISFYPIKDGRSVNKIHFTVSSKDSYEALKLRSENEHELGLDQMTLWDVLESKGQV